MSNNIKLIYGHDPLCGWCYGFGKVIKAFSESLPEVPVSVYSGGLFSGARTQAYSNLYDFIKNASGHLRDVTGRSPSEAFFNMIRSPEAGLANSTPPSLALALVKEQAPEQLLTFAVLLQELHFEKGLSFNQAKIYDEATQLLSLPPLDTGAVLQATDKHPKVEAMYRRTAALGIRSFPTCLVINGENTVLDTISGVYNADDFIARVARHINK